MELSKLERLKLVNQYLILEKLYPEEADYFANHRKAVQEGYKLHYKWIFENIDKEMSEEECREVLDILEMYRAITWSYMDIKGVKEISEYKYMFPGFDGNNEPEQLSYASYFIFDLERYQELLYGKEYASLNSHAPKLEQYRRMLEIWKSYGGKTNAMRLTLEQIDKLLEA